MTGLLDLVLVLVAAVAIGSLGWVFLGMIQEYADTRGMPTLKGEGVIVEKSSTPGFLQPLTIGSVMILQHFPDDFEVCVEHHGRQDYCDVSRKRYRRLSVGQKVSFKYQVGRSGAYYLRSVR